MADVQAEHGTGDSPAHHPERGEFASRLGLVLPSVALNRPFVMPQQATGSQENAQTDLPLPIGDAAASKSALGTSAALPASEASRRALALPQISVGSVGSAMSLQATRFAGEILRQGYRIGNLGFLVGYEEASELSELVPIFRLPAVAAWVRGLVNLHGNIVPVFDLGTLLALDQGAASVKAKSGVGLADTMLLVLGHREASAAVLIDGVPERKRFRARDQMDSAIVPDAVRNYVRAVYADPSSGTADETVIKRNSYWIELDHARFFEDMMPRML